MKFRKKPVVVEAVRWWPPGDPQHDSTGTPVKWPATACLNTHGCDCEDLRDCDDPEHKIQDGDIGSNAGTRDSKPSPFWIRKNNSTAQYLRPGDWIVRGDTWPAGINVVPSDLFAATYEPA